MQKLKGVKFSDFSDPKLYGGFVPSGRFLQEVFIHWVQSIEECLNKEVRAQKTACLGCASLSILLHNRLGSRAYLVWRWLCTERKRARKREIERECV